MKKIINDPNDFVKESIEGICLAYPNQIKMHNNDFRMIIRTKKKIKKVAIITAGGSGHLPVFLGYVGKGLLDGCAVGDTFASPSSSKMFELIKHCDEGKGVFCLFGNYGGDKLNFKMAKQEAEFYDILTDTLVINDDIASATLDKKETRRGVAGMVYAFKIAGAASELDYTLNDVVTVTKKALNNIRTMGVALSPCILPSVGTPNFNVEPGMMEVGMGIHGEAGILITKLKTADEIAQIIFTKIISEISFSPNDSVSIMVNGLGATPLEEQFIVYRKLVNLFKELKVNIKYPHIGEFATSMEMTGLSVTIFKLDEELSNLMNYEAITPFYYSGNK